VTFQIVLTEGSNAVLFQYRSVDLGAGNPATSGAQATVGIRNAAGMAHNQQIQWSYRVPVIHDKTALLFQVLDSTAPEVTAAVTPAVLWPPNGQTMDVILSGTITDNRGLAGARYVVTDEYGLPQPAGVITLAADGSYSVTLPLVADRHSDDKDGRKYTIVVLATDLVGNEGTATTAVTVLHDQRKK
jgi:hypothetical protein